MKNAIEVKILIKKICAKDDAVFLDHDLNVSILNKKLREKFKALTKAMIFNELNRVVGYFIDELEGDGINMDYEQMDDPDKYLAYCLDECEQTLEDVQNYVNEFKANNLE